MTLEGALYRGSEHQYGTDDLDLSGGHVQASWKRQLRKGSMLQMLGYFDEARRFATATSGYTLDTYNLGLGNTAGSDDRRR